jgi:protein tyrosine phosphatase (PTP) superfamily phosphohydrolase (DUF442 family)
MTNHEIYQITNYLVINDNLLTGGMPTADQLPVLQFEKIDLVVNLAIEDSPSATSNEREILNSLGISYHNIPVVWEDPKASDLTQFFSIMDENESKKMFVHCVLNMRVSAFVFLYFVIKKQMHPEIAFLNLRKIWEPNLIWQTFINKALLAHNKEPFFR